MPDLLLPGGTPALDLAGAALSRARELGAAHADFRLTRTRTAVVQLRDGLPESSHDGEDLGVAVRVIHGGSWGFASGTAKTLDAVRQLSERAVRAANISQSIGGSAVALAPEPVYRDAVWTSVYQIDPFDVPYADRVGRLAELSERLQKNAGVHHVDAAVTSVRETRFYADTAGTVTTQKRIYVHPRFTAHRRDSRTGELHSLRSTAPPAGRGWEYLAGAGWDFESELDQLPEHLIELAQAPAADPRQYDLVVDPTQLWHTIHESIGHATELDRVLGLEAGFAGTSFATFDRLHSLRYGSEIMNVVADRTADHGLATVGYDDEGVKAQEFDLVRGGVLTGYQLDRQMAQEKGFGRSNGCAFADSSRHVPLQRMANVSLRPDPDGPDLDGLVSAVDDGLLVVGDKSWSIDMQRYNFQFTGQRFHRIKNGRIVGQVRDAAYQASTLDFWGSLAALGGPGTYHLGGVMNCGKGQPLQLAPVSHGSPAALFRNVNVISTSTGGRRT